MERAITCPGESIYNPQSSLTCKHFRLRFYTTENTAIHTELCHAKILTCHCERPAPELKNEADFQRVSLLQRSLKIYQAKDSLGRRSATSILRFWHKISLLLVRC